MQSTLQNNLKKPSIINIYLISTIFFLLITFSLSLTIIGGQVENDFYLTMKTLFSGIITASSFYLYINKK